MESEARTVPRSALYKIGRNILILLALLVLLVILANIVWLILDPGHRM